MCRGTGPGDHERYTFRLSDEQTVLGLPPALAAVCVPLRHAGAASST